LSSIIGKYGLGFVLVLKSNLSSWDNIIAQWANNGSVDMEVFDSSRGIVDLSERDRWTTEGQMQ
jgi:hypothetical protein